MMRLDAMLRVDPTTDRLSVALDGGGLTSVTLTHGLYTPAELVAHIEARLQAVDDPAWEVTLSAAGVVQLAATGHTLAVTWTRPALRNWLGWSANVSGASNTATAPASCAGVLIPSLPWRDLAPLGWRLETSRGETWRRSGRSFKRSLVRTWQVTARVTSAELATFRAVLAQLTRGAPARWWRNTAVATAWSWTSPAGYVDVVIDAGGLDLPEQWLESGGARLVVEVPLRFVERIP